MFYMGTKILIVDDHDDFRKAVRKHLENQNLDAEVFEADCGEVGVAMAARRVPDVILMDIRLPGIDGLDAALKIKTQFPQSKIIFLTMFETQAFREAFATQVASDYIGKSDLYDKLVPAIKRVLGKK